MKTRRIKSNAGFSIIELMLVLAIIMVMSGILAFYLSNQQKLYKPDEQSIKLIDILQEARQRSLTQKETMRVEIDLSDRVIRLIDENTPTTAGDDQPIKIETLLAESEVQVERRPNEIPYNPSEPAPVPNAQFKPSIYPPSTPHHVCTIRFQSNGTVVDAGNDAIGNGAVVTGLTLHVWSPKDDAPNESDIARAITVIGGTGSVRHWEYNRASSSANKWTDSRRVSVY